MGVSVDPKDYIINGLTTLFKKKLSNHGCEFGFIPEERYPAKILIVYQGSTDPGTIKSKFIPTIFDIHEIIELYFGSSTLSKTYTFDGPHLWSHQYLDNQLLKKYKGYFEFDSDIEYVSRISELRFVYKFRYSYTVQVDYIVPSILLNYISNA